MSFTASPLTAASYAELGSAIPLNGGARTYLHHTYGAIFGFLFSWTMMIAVKPSGLGVVSIILAKHVNRVLFLFLRQNDTTSVLADTVVALLCVWLTITVQSISSRWAMILNNFFTIIKVMALLAVSLIGAIVWGTLCNYSWSQYASIRSRFDKLRPQSFHWIKHRYRTLRVGSLCWIVGL